MSFVTSGPDAGFSFVLLAFVAIVLIASWVILAASRFVQGGIVERPERVPQLYGYTACLIALVVGLSSIAALVDSGLTLANPAYADADEWTTWSEPSITSFEAFRVTYDRARQFPTSDAPPPEPVPEDELRRRYEALRTDRIERTRIAAQRSLVTSALMLVLAAGIFAWHWRWLRRRVEAPSVVRAASA